MAAKQTLRLSQVRAGQVVRIISVASCADLACRVREMGLLEGRTVRILMAGNPLMCEVGHCRLGLCQRLARTIEVQVETVGANTRIPVSPSAHQHPVPIKQ